MTVYKKLQEARYRLVNTQLNKSGKNKFAGFEYFELGDFIPQVHKIFNEVGLCGVVSFADVAVLTVYDTDDSTWVSFQTPIVNAENAKGQAIQSLGATHTYLRRYLWLLAMEIVEHDAVDSVAQEEPKVKAKIEVKPVEKPAEKPADKSADLTLVLSEDQMLFLGQMKEWGKAATSQAELSSLWKANLVQLEKIGKIDLIAHASIKEFFRALKETLKGNKNG
jgi:hypothetical protein